MEQHQRQRAPPAVARDRGGCQQRGKDRWKGAAGAKLNGPAALTDHLASEEAGFSRVRRQAPSQARRQARRRARRQAPRGCHDGEGSGWAGVAG